MSDLKKQMQLFALIGKVRTAVKEWQIHEYQSPGAVEAVKARLTLILAEIDARVIDTPGGPK